MADVIAMNAGEVAVLRCRACGTLDPGPRELCPKCASDDLETTAVPGSGTLVSTTVIRRPPTAFRGEGPYAIAIVDLDAGVRLTGRIVAEDADAAPGVRVELAEMHDRIPVFRMTR